MRNFGYQDRKQDADLNGQGPRAPGMKYRHYAPRGTVFLFEAGVPETAVRDRIEQELADRGYLKIGMVRTTRWAPFLNLSVTEVVSANDHVSRDRWRPTNFVRVNGEERA